MECICGRDFVSQACDALFVASDSDGLSADDFSSALTRLEINDLSDQQIQCMFNAMISQSTDVKTAISRQDIFAFLDAAFEPHTHAFILQHLLLSSIHRAVLTQSSSMPSSSSAAFDSHRYYHRQIRHDRRHSRLLQSEIWNVVHYTPSPSFADISAAYQAEIRRLKSQLQQTIDTLKQTIHMNAMHIDEHQRAIAQLRYSLAQKQEEEDAGHILAQTLLDPELDYQGNDDDMACAALQWTVDDVLAWLKENNLMRYHHAFNQHKIDGYKLLHEVYQWNHQQFMQYLQCQNLDEMQALVNSIEQLKKREMPPQVAISEIHPPSQSESPTPSISPLERYENMQQENCPPSADVSEEICKLKEEIERLQASKLQLIDATSTEIQRLRDMLKDSRCRHVL